MLHAPAVRSSLPRGWFGADPAAPALTWGTDGSPPLAPPLAPPPTPAPPPAPPSCSATHAGSVDSACCWHQRAVSAGEGGAGHWPSTVVSSTSRTDSG